MINRKLEPEFDLPTIQAQRVGTTVSPSPAHLPLSLAGLYEQTKWWCQANGEWIRIKEMDLKHLTNLMWWMERNAGRTHLGIMLEMIGFSARVNGDMASDMIDSLIDRHEDTTPSDWLHAQPLYQRIIRRIRKLSTITNKETIT